MSIAVALQPGYLEEWSRRIGGNLKAENENLYLLALVDVLIEISSYLSVCNLHFDEIHGTGLYDNLKNRVVASS